MSRAQTIYDGLSGLIGQVLSHNLYPSIDNLKKMQRYMEYDVFTCWDCMSLIKEIYKKIVSVESPWFPPRDAYSASLFCGIIAEEESDICPDGKTYASHFDLYLDAMRQAGASTKCIDDFMKRLRNGESMLQALELCGTKSFVQQYVATTLGFFKLEVHQIAAAFAFGREAIAPTMFVAFLENVRNGKFTEYQEQLQGIIYFCDRHIDLDSSSHLPKMLQMLDNLCGNDEQKWREVNEVAILSIQAKIDYFTQMQLDLSKI
ncbi:MAG: hypothetical protein QG673_1351 [Pseudomonadota bacterium]|nr:hypothetical protein [Pseudomonadota bacterium]